MPDLSTLIGEEILPIIFALMATATFVFVWLSLIERDPLPKRLRSLDSTRRAMRQDAIAQESRRNKGLLDNASFAKDMVERMNLLKSKTASSVQLKLARAGWRSRDAMVTYFFFKVASPFIFGGIGLFFFHLINPFGFAPMGKVAFSMGSVILGYLLPDIIITNTAQKRQEKITKALADTFDLMVICAEAGLSLDTALDRVSREISESSGEMSEEMGLTAIELGFLPDRQQALRNLEERVPLQAIRALVNTLIQSERYGTPLAQAMRVLASEMRNERMMKAEEKAARLPAIMTLPMVMFILPPLFIVLIGPAALRTFDAFTKL